jgi:hypothetical protein
MQGNNKPLATKIIWATTFENCKGAKVPAVRSLIIAISIIAPAMKLVPLQPPLQQMHWSKTFKLSLREAMLTWLRRVTINFVDC